MYKRGIQCLLFIVLSCGAPLSAQKASQILVPKIEGEFWQIAGEPNLGQYNSPKQQPVDFAIWPAEDGTWQLWSCIRDANVPGKTRLFYRWQAKNLTDSNWTPMGIAMMADTHFGEMEGGLQAPYVFKVGSDYYMFYGTWGDIAIAKSKDGKTFERLLMPDGKSGLFPEFPGTRDPMVLKIGTLYHLYYTADPDGQGVDFVRTSRDLLHWSKPVRVSYGGSPGNGPSSAECPFVYHDASSGYYYLLRNQYYGRKARFTVYRSKNPMDFGKDSDRDLVEVMPYAAPEVVQSGEQLYLAVLLPNLKGIEIARLQLAPK